MIPFTLDGIEMNTGQADHNNAIWLVTEQQGWFDSPDLRQSVIDRSLGHGSILAMIQMDRRTVRLGGRCKVKGTEHDIWASRDRLLSALNTFTAPKTLVVVEAGVAKQITYWAGGAADVRIMPGGFEFDITLMAEDPRKYSTSVYTSANISGGANANIRPEGSFQSSPILTISNIANTSVTFNTMSITNTVGGSVVGTIQVLSYTSPAGENTITIDVMNRTVVGGSGINRYGQLSAAGTTWFDLTPQQNNTIAVTHTGTPRVAVAYRDTYL